MLNKIIVFFIAKTEITNISSTVQSMTGEMCPATASRVKGFHSATAYCDAINGWTENARPGSV